MDGLSALSVAASVAQFIEFGFNLVSKSKEIYKSGHGASKQHVESASAAKRIIELSEGMKASLALDSAPRTFPTEQHRSLGAICDGCIAVSEQLLAQLEKLRVRDGSKNRRWKSFRLALKSVWSKSAIDEIAMRLGNYKRELNGFVLVSLSQKFHNLSIMQDQSFTSLDATLQRNIERLLLRLIEMHTKVDEVLAIQRRYMGTNEKKLALDRQAQTRVDDSTVNSFILASLRFPSMGHREEAICEAHQATSRWIFEETLDTNEEKRPWSNFVEWLLNDRDIYWINGKAGSGKSTLMKYIHHNPDTLRHLQSWAGGAELQVAHFYFWNGGSKEQRSYTGLLRSLLYDILNSQKDLIRLVFPDEWHETRLLVDRVKFFEEPPSWSWSFAKLEKVLDHIENLLSDRFKWCLFVDGLDEFDGDLDTIIAIFQRLSRSPNFKVCLSSRPWLIFEEAFGHNPGLRLQNLTCNDIQVYVRDKLDGNHKMQQLLKSDLTRAATFSQTIISKANGVFLWVRLVVASLLNGLRNRDDISDLQKRLEAIPSELDDLYSHMLGRIEPIYLQQASQIFEIFNSATDLSLQLTLLELELAVSSSFDEAMTPAGSSMSDEEIVSRCLRMRTVLQSRCEGLLETHDLMDRNWEAIDDIIDNSFTSSDANNCGDLGADAAQKLMTGWKASYLHRTVKDYLRSQEVRAKLRRAARGTASFDPNLSLLQSYVINMKRSICSYYSFARVPHEAIVWRTAEDAFLLAECVGHHSRNRSLNLLHEINIVSSHWFCQPESPLFPWEIDNISICVPLAGQRHFLLMAVRTNRYDYMRKWLKDYARSIPRFHEKLLECALRLRVDYMGSGLSHDSSELFPSMVELLLRHGANPNALSSYNAPETIWQRFILSLRTGSFYADTVESEARVFKALLQSGANPQATFAALVTSPSSGSKQLSKPSTIASVIKERCTRWGLPAGHATWVPVTDLLKSDSDNHVKRQPQPARLSSATKPKKHNSKKRFLANSRANGASDDERTRRPLKRQRRRAR